MKRYGKEYIIDGVLMEIISAYMDNELKEQVHIELAPLIDVKSIREKTILSQSEFFEKYNIPVGTIRDWE